MKNILAIAASRNMSGETLKIVQSIKETFLIIDKEVKFNIFTPYDYNLNFSDHPRDGFIYGMDINEKDRLDDSSKLKKQMEEADLIIFASPTYFANVSADMKLFIDRFCHLAHLFYFAKKPCITLVASDGNGHIQASNYLKTFCDGLGLVRVKELISVRNNPISKEEIAILVKYAIQKINNADSLRTNSSMEMAFQYWKKSIIKQNANLPEYKYWEKNNMFHYETLQEYFAKK